MTSQARALCIFESRGAMQGVHPAEFKQLFSSTLKVRATWPGNRRLLVMTTEFNQTWTCYARSRRSHLRRNRLVFSKLPPNPRVSPWNDTLSNVTNGNDSAGSGSCQGRAPRIFFDRGKLTVHSCVPIHGTLIALFQGDVTIVTKKNGVYRKPTQAGCHLYR